MADSTEDLDFLSYDEVRERVSEDGVAHLLVGNGFSIGLDPIFRYTSLYQKAVEAGLSERAQHVFERLGTNNFEGVMRLLDDTHWVALTYGLLDEGESSGMRDDVEVVKNALIEALTESHLPHAAEVPDPKKESALEFLQPYFNVFTTNYDLVLYWVIMHHAERGRHQDGFGNDPDDPNEGRLVFRERLGRRKGIYYLHGALHLFVRDGHTCKHSWIREGAPLIDLVRAGLDTGEYPLFVADVNTDSEVDTSNGLEFDTRCVILPRVA